MSSPIRCRTATRAGTSGLIARRHDATLELDDSFVSLDVAARHHLRRNFWMTAMYLTADYIAPKRGRSRRPIASTADVPSVQVLAISGT